MLISDTRLYSGNQPKHAVQRVSMNDRYRTIAAPTPCAALSFSGRGVVRPSVRFRGASSPTCEAERDDLQHCEH